MSGEKSSDMTQSQGDLKNNNSNIWRILSLIFPIVTEYGDWIDILCTLWGKISSGNVLVWKDFCHIAKISSLFPDEISPDKLFVKISVLSPHSAKYGPESS